MHYFNFENITTDLGFLNHTGNRPLQLLNISKFMTKVNKWTSAQRSAIGQVQVPYILPYMACRLTEVQGPPFFSLSHIPRGLIPSLFLLFTSTRRPPWLGVCPMQALLFMISVSECASPTSQYFLSSDTTTAASTTTYSIFSIPLFFMHSIGFSPNTVLQTTAFMTSTCSYQPSFPF